MAAKLCTLCTNNLVSCLNSHQGTTTKPHPRHTLSTPHTCTRSDIPPIQKRHYVYDTPGIASPHRPTHATPPPLPLKLQQQPTHACLTSGSNNTNIQSPQLSVPNFDIHNVHIIRSRARAACKHCSRHQLDTQALTQAHHPPKHKHNATKKQTLPDEA